MIKVRSRYQARFYRPRDLAALISLYEANYVRMMQLAPELDRLSDTVVSRVAGALDLYMTVLERHKYTTTVNLTYRFDGDDSSALEPNARICVYHDVRSVELVSHCRRRRVRSYQPWPVGRMPEVERRWEMNRFLLKWLKFCAHQGHIFLQCTTRPRSPSRCMGARSRGSAPPHLSPDGRLKKAMDGLSHHRANEWLSRIVSGGQTGVDRAALDAALEFGIDCGGWCPAGRRAEDGRISSGYPLRETSATAYRIRTRYNVRDSDATLVVKRDEVSGGTALTMRIAHECARPCLVIDIDASDRVTRLLGWLEQHPIRILNVAGPRESQRPGIYCDTFRYLTMVLPRARA